MTRKIFFPTKVYFFLQKYFSLLIYVVNLKGFLYVLCWLLARDQMSGAGRVHQNSTISSQYPVSSHQNHFEKNLEFHPRAPLFRLIEASNLISIKWMLVLMYYTQPGLHSFQVPTQWLLRLS